MSSKEVESGLGILPLNPSANIGVAALIIRALANSVLACGRRMLGSEATLALGTII